MGLPLKVSVGDEQELELNSIISFANEKYTEAERKNNNIVDSNRLRAIAVLEIVMELQAIKGKQEVFLDTNTKRMNELIKLVDSMDLPV